MKHKIFEDNPHLEKVFVTSDDEAFYNESDAKNHGKRLKDKNVETVYNPDHMPVSDPEEISQAEPGQDNPENAENHQKGTSQAGKVVDLNPDNQAKVPASEKPAKAATNAKTATTAKPKGQAKAAAKKPAAKPAPDAQGDQTGTEPQKK